MMGLSGLLYLQIFYYPYNRGGLEPVDTSLFWSFDGISEFSIDIFGWCSIFVVVSMSNFL